MVSFDDSASSHLMRIEKDVSQFFSRIHSMSCMMRGVHKHSTPASIPPLPGTGQSFGLKDRS